MSVLKTTTNEKVRNAVELLLQVVELFPNAREHVSQYVSYDELIELQDTIKQQKGEAK